MCKSIVILTSEFPPYGGGIATYAAELASAAHRSGHEIHVVAPDMGEDQTIFDQKFPFVVHRYSGRCFGNRRTWSAFKAANKLLKKGRYDIVHAVDPVFGNILTILGWFRRQPFTWTVYGSEILMAFTTLEGRFNRYIGTFRAASKIFAISAYTQSLLLDKFPKISPKNVQVTRLGVSDYWFQDHDTVDVRGAYDISPDKKVILTAARVTRRKGQDLVIEAISKLPEEYKTSITYVVVGSVKDPQFQGQLERLASVSGVQVVFTGAVPLFDLCSWYDTAWLHCMPGRHDPSVVEGLGLTYLEAAARGCPSVACRIGGIPEAIRHNETGILLSDETVDALIGVLLRLLKDKKLRDELASAARAWAKTFSWDACAHASYAEDEDGMCAS